MKNYWVHVSYIEDRSFQKDIIKVINKSTDEQNYKTNVKAKMTSWVMKDEPGFSSLVPYFLKKAEELYLETYNSIQKFYIQNLWGMCYKSNDFAVPHDHIPSILSCVYYINPPVNGPNLLFPEIEKSIEPKDGMLVIFPSWVLHEVPAKKFTGKRYVVSANLCNIRN